MLSITQNKAIYDFVLKQFTISETVFIANCIYENQFLPLRQAMAREQQEDEMGYPLVSIDYDESDAAVNDIGDGGVWNSLLLEINLYSKDFDGRPLGEHINGQIMVNEMSRLSMNHFNSDFNSDTPLLAQNVKLNKEVTKNRDLSQIAGEQHIYRLMIEVPIIYKLQT